MKTHFIFLILIVISLNVSAQRVPLQDSVAIMDVLNMQIDAWDKGDLDQFMESYWKSEELVFTGSDGPIWGWKNTLARYKRNYPDKASRGKLTFDILHMRSLGLKAAIVIGKFHLDRQKGNAEGYFTLVWQKMKGKWLIVSDHTS